MMRQDISSIAGKFRMDGDFQSAGPWGAGHINDTYLAVYDSAGVPSRIIIQRINRHVFKNPPAVMENIVRVTNHIHHKLMAEGVPDIFRRVLSVVPTRDGASFYKDPAGDYWRAYLFIENGKTCDIPESPALVGETARMFGQFISMLGDVPGPPLSETIKDFHNGPKRLLAFQEAVETDSHNRAKDAAAEIEFILNNADTFDVPAKLVSEGRIPVRITHNDTKINNVIFDCRTKQGLCIIDLDTVMPGLALYDFGDMVRTAACPAAEDERDLSKVAVDMRLFEAILRGFLRGTGALLTPTEKQYLPFAGKYITLEQAARFLTDYLQGDVYYKVHRDGHNLDRCRTQLKLVQSIVEQQGEMLSLLEKI